MSLTIHELLCNFHILTLKVITDVQMVNSKDFKQYAILMLLKRPVYLDYIIYTCIILW